MIDNNKLILKQNTAANGQIDGCERLQPEGATEKALTMVKAKQMRGKGIFKIQKI